jgi:hypothetical protein
MGDDGGLGPRKVNSKEASTAEEVLNLKQRFELMIAADPDPFPVAQAQM